LEWGDAKPMSLRNEKCAEIRDSAARQTDQRICDLSCDAITDARAKVNR
jgi:hypothetical protein